MKTYKSIDASNWCLEFYKYTFYEICQNYSRKQLTSLWFGSLNKPTPNKLRSRIIFTRCNIMNKLKSTTLPAFPNDI
jgi:hypothetical protein